MSERKLLTRRGFVAQATTAAAAVAVAAGRADGQASSVTSAAGLAGGGGGEQGAGASGVRPFSLTDVRLGPGPFRDAPGKGLPAPEILASRAAPWVERVPGERLAFRTVGQSPPVSLVPLYRVFGERYAVYWNVRTRSLPT
jgi:hypothetical protein